MCRAVGGLPQAGILEHKSLQKRLLPHGCFEFPNTPSLWKHSTCPILFTLVVDNFGVKYVGKEHFNHSIKCIKTRHELTKDWARDLYCGIKLKWDCTAGTLNISMLGYITKLLHKYKDCVPLKPQRCPYSPAPKQYGAKAHASLPIEISTKLSPDNVKQIQRIIGSILYYAWGTDITVLMDLSSIAIKETKGTTSTMEKAKQLLDYLAKKSNATIRYRASAFS
jgi:hypothetical protein